MVPLSWDRSQFRVAAAAALPGLEKGMMLTDEPQDFTVHCSSVQLSEGPPPHWLRGQSGAPAVG